MMRWFDVLRYAKYGNPEPPYKEEKTEAEWQLLLTPAQYQVARQKGTELPYRNAYCRFYDPGNYSCVCCGSLLFTSSEKYHAISGWPSFTQPVTKSAVKYAFDDSHNMQRIEVLCNICDAHLGHVFNDGPEPAGLRYCINSVCLVHQESKV
ncbi:peptide-methionine (R)-S-oxide reductase MsrB [Pontibacter sp. H249]|uniref:peptide-methionine (R)-S-oxide reductase MsrB n=1 Tax=Pontibacter sp. H249 TaxID=3133420 RepID=UPI0030C3AB08